MKMTADTEAEIEALENLLAEAAQVPPEVPPQLAARILADARAEQARVLRRPVSRGGFLEWLRASVGGWPAVGGLAAATCAGFWIGISPPQGIPDAGALLLDAETAQFEEDTGTIYAFGWEPGEG
jgi:hypothetical protein